MSSNMSSAGSCFGFQRQNGDVPFGRFGHTCTYVGGTYVVLFGGATGDGGRFSINNDTYLLDMRNNYWRKLTDQQPSRSSSSTSCSLPPAQRAAHAACCIDQMQMVVYGGATGGGALTSEELFLLDLQSIPTTNNTSFSLETVNPKFSWSLIPVAGGPSPGKRYGHLMVYSKPNIVIFGGNNGQSSLNDVWVMDLSSPLGSSSSTGYSWKQVTVIDPLRAPLPRVYHSGDICGEGPATGMTVIFGGRTSDNKSLRDIWGLRQHRDGRWDWVEAPIKRGNGSTSSSLLEPRFQHLCLFWKTKLFIIGGRGSEPNKPLPVAVYDTESCEWRNVGGVSPPSATKDTVDRYRHAIWQYQEKVYVFGGFSHFSPSSPNNDLLLSVRPLAGLLGEGSTGGNTILPGSTDQLNLAQQAVESNLSMTRDFGIPSTVSNVPTPPSTGLRHQLTLSSQVFVAAGVGDREVRKVGLDSLGEEGRKVRGGGMQIGSGPFTSSPVLVDSTVKHVLEELLRPSVGQQYTPSVRFFLSPSELSKLTKSVLELIKSQPMVLHVRAPIKVFGDLHGQYADLMRMFAKYGSPSFDQGDIDTTDYLFLGDFVDRGSFSLEIIVLLFALKLRHPSQVHLIRGNHEDPTINALYGFKDECRRRIFGEDPDMPHSFYAQCNEVFEWLPCGAIIENRVLCIHGGIGGSIDRVSDIENLQRPLKVSQSPNGLIEQKVTDLLWSDPSDSDLIHGITGNETRDPDGSGRIVKFGPDRVHQFLKNNPPLELIIRAHECVMDGFERFAGGKLITVFSATDYCGHHKNAGALLFIRKDLTVVPKLIYPVTATTSSGNFGGSKDSLEERSSGFSWDSRITQTRPPTPPRPPRLSL